MRKVYSVVIVTLVVCVGCGPRQRPATSDSSAEKQTDRAAVINTDSKRAVENIAAIEKQPGLENFMRVSDRIYSGGQPEGEQAFESLAKLGVKTVVTVDGARPDVEAARRHGLRYVHVPIGYDGIPEKAGAALARVVAECEGPIYFHCHHGQHRGPAAAAAACIASGAADGQSALGILERAGTSKEYPGLWRDVAAYSPPKPDADLPDLHEIAPVSSLAAAMAKIDRSYDLLKLCRAAEWSVPPKHPDVVPEQEALQIKEGLHEAARTLGEDFDDQFKSWLGDAEAIALQVETSLRAGSRDAASHSFQLLEKSCKRCHAKYRN